MGQHLASQIEDLDYGDHACMIYDDHEEQMASVLPFIKSGLERNQACLYIGNDLPLAEIKSAFSGYGINVNREVERGALIFSENNMQGGKFQAGSMVETLRGLVQDAKSKGFDGMRASGEMTWVLGSDCGCDELTHYEALLNEEFPTELVGICQYNRQRFEPKMIHNILRTHPVVIVKDKVCRNLYCESDRIVKGKWHDDYGVHWMIDNLVRFHTLEEKLRAMVEIRDDFMSIAGHELRTPLFALKLQHEVYSREPTLTPDQWTDFKTLHSRNLENLIGIVNGMLDVTLMSRGSLKLHLRDGVDLIEIVRESIRHFNRNRQIGLQSPETLRLTCDPVRMGQVIHNLLSNAVKYGSDQPIQVQIVEKADSAVISVRDRGLGIAPENHKRIFELYERALGHKNISGLGIGLYLSDQIVKAHKGHMSLISALEKGSTFQVELPLNG